MSEIGKQLIKSLEEALEWTKGDTALRTTTLAKNANGDIEVLEKTAERRIDKEPDGKQELDYGKEELDKDGKKMKVSVKEMVDEHEDLVDALESPSKKDDKKEAKKQKKELKEYKKKLTDPVNIDEEGSARNPKQPEPGDLSKTWSDLKKALSDEAFLDIREASGLAEEEEEEAQQEQQQEAPPEGGVEQEDMEAGEAAPEEMEDAEGQPEGEMSEGDEAEMLAEMTGEDPEQIQEELSPEEIEQKLIEALQEEGMSDDEIAHVIHGHGVPIVDPVDQSKIDLNSQKAEQGQANHDHDLSHKKRMSDMEADHKQRLQDAEYENKKKAYDLTDLENNHKRRMLELEYEQAKEDSQINDMDRIHKKRMLDLEYEYEQKQKELELEMKRKEMDIKMKQKADQAKDRHAQQKEVSAVRHEQRMKDVKADASKTSEAEKKGTMKKSDEEIDDLEKSAKLWSHNPKTGQINHPEHGAIAFKPHKEGIEIVHNGKSVGVHPDKGAAMSAAKDYMIGLHKPSVKVKSST